ncbi:chalcone-flavanone isomerase [Colletotrichum tofieldiae]|nr:chalcone-flavanone isomerase [Colletotrichum tofieldiae]
MDSDGVEYTLVGLGIRTVSFLSIQVYMVGYYVATADVAKLQHYLTKKINPIATTLVPSERDSLKAKLLDPAEGEETWSALLQEVGCRSAFRIVPVRDTDFPHLRDGFVRAITARSSTDKEAYGDEAFGEAMKEFKRLFNRGKVQKEKELLLCRDEKGTLEVVFDDGRSSGRQTVGKVQDERVSRLLWLNWLAGSKVASEAARHSIIDGVMEFVERPVGTVATQVV